MATIEELKRRDRQRKQAEFLFAQQMQAPWIGAGVVADDSVTPITILGAKLQFWFDNTYGVTLNGSDVSSQVDRTGNFTRSQASGPAQPAISNGIITYDGAATFLELESPASLLNDTTGFIISIIDPLGSGVSVSCVNSGDEADTNENLTMLIRSTEDYQIQARQGGSNNFVEFTGTVLRNQFCSLGYASSGTAYRHWLNGTELAYASGTNDGDWYGDIAGLDNMTFGALVRSSTSYVNFTEKQVLYCSEVPTAGELSSLWTWAANYL